MQQNDLLRLQGVAFSYRRKLVLQQVDFGLRGGRVLAVVGPNGSGKTTLLRIAAGLLRPSSGTVVRTTAVAGFIERPSLYDHLTGEENLELARRLTGAPASVTTYWTRFWEIDGALGTRVADYSCGMRQRLGLIKVLMVPAPLVLLDEPWVGLDPEGRILLRRVIAEMRAAGRAVVLTSHELRELDDQLDDLLILRFGQQLGFYEQTALREIRRPALYRLTVLADQLPDGGDCPVMRADGLPEAAGCWQFECRQNQLHALLDRLLRQSCTIADITVQNDDLETMYQRLLGYEG